MAERRRWFKNRKFGWGWVPITWQGWLAVGAYVFIIFTGSRILFDDMAPSNSELILFFGWTFFWTIPLFYVSYKTGDVPRWRWGGKDENDR